MIGGIMSRISYGAPFYFAAALAAANALLLYLILPESLPQKHRSNAHEDARATEVFRHGHGWLFAAVVATYFFLVAGFAMMTTLYALFTEKRFGYDAHANGYLFGYIGILSAVVQGGLIGRLVQRVGETVLARIGLVITTAAMATLPLSGNLPLLLLVSAGLAIGSGLASPTLSGLASKMIDPSWQGRALGLLQSSGSLARLVGPLLGGWLLMNDLGKPVEQYARTPFWAGAVISGIAVLVALCVRAPAGSRTTEPARVEADV